MFGRTRSLHGWGGYLKRYLVTFFALVSFPLCFLARGFAESNTPSPALTESLYNRCIQGLEDEFDWSIFVSCLNRDFVVPSAELERRLKECGEDGVVLDNEVKSCHFYELGIVRPLLLNGELVDCVNETDSNIRRTCFKAIVSSPSMNIVLPRNLTYSDIELCISERSGSESGSDEDPRHLAVFECLRERKLIPSPQN